MVCRVTSSTLLPPASVVPLAHICASLFLPSPFLCTNHHLQVCRLPPGGQALPRQWRSVAASMSTTCQVGHQVTRLCLHSKGQGVRLTPWPLLLLSTGLPHISIWW
jgi:hypothetical protein